MPTLGLVLGTAGRLGEVFLRHFAAFSSKREAQAREVVGISRMTK